MSESKTRIAPATLAGRCANGYERGAGRVVHAVMCADRELRFGIDSYARSLCGKTHGARSAGWGLAIGYEVTCPRCIKLAGTLSDEQREWAEAILSNDEASTDQELVEHFVEGGMDRADAVAAVAHRDKFLNQDPNNPPHL